MKYYIDFDNTIFNTTDFFNDYKELLRSNGVNEEIDYNLCD